MTVVARGSVADRPFARTIYAIAAKRFTGDMRMSQDGQTLALAWQGGWVVGAASDAPQDSHGRVALAAGLVSSTQLGDAIRRAAGPDALLDVLAQVASLSPGQVAHVRQHTLVYRALRVFAFPAGAFELDDAAAVAREPDAEPLHPRWLIYHGVRKNYDLERLRQEMAPVEGAAFRLIAAESALADFGLDSRARPYIALLGRQAMALDALLDAVPNADEARARALLYALVATDSVEVQLSSPRASSGRVARTTGPQRRAAATTGPQRRAAATTGPQRRAAATTGPHGSSALSRTRPNTHNAVKVSTAARNLAQSQGASAAQIRKLLASKLADLDNGADHFRILGVATNASDAAVRQAFFSLAKSLHPDRLQALGITDMPDAAQRVFAELNRAFATLSDATARARYEADQAARDSGAESRDDVESRAARLLAAERHFLQGEMAMRRDDFAAAVKEFEVAIQLNPDEAEHHALLGWATWCAASDKRSVQKEVKRMLSKAVALSPKSATPVFYRGRIAAFLHDDDLAIECFRKVLELSPRHKDADLELRVLLNRRERNDKKKGLLDRLKRR